MSPLQVFYMILCDIKVYMTLRDLEMRLVRQQNQMSVAVIVKMVDGAPCVVSEDADPFCNFLPCCHLHSDL